MFDKMMSYEIAWALFCEWFINKYKATYNFTDMTFHICLEGEKLPDDLILSSMPLFFFENGINTSIFADQLKESCEQIFRILENQLNNQEVKNK